MLWIAAIGVLLPLPATSQNASTELPANTTTAGSQIQQAVAVDGSGNFLVVWQSDGEDGDLTGVFARGFDTYGNPVSAPFMVNTHTTNYQQYPDVATDGAGSFMVVWFGHGPTAGDLGEIWARTMQIDGTPVTTPEFQVNTSTTGSQYYPAIAAKPGGPFQIVWTGGTDIWGQQLLANGTPVGSELQVNTDTTGYQAYPTVATDASGRFVVAWQSYDSDATGIFAKQFTAAGVGGSEFQINAYATGEQGFPSVAAAGGGDFVIAWQSADQYDAGKGVFARRWLQDGTAIDASDIHVNTFTANQQVFPRVSVDASESFVVVWESVPIDRGFGYPFTSCNPVQQLGGQDGGCGGVFGQKFAWTPGPSPPSPPATIGTEFRANCSETDDQRNPVVAAHGDQEFVVAWDSRYYSAPAGQDVFAREVPCQPIVVSDASPSVFAACDGAGTTATFSVTATGQVPLAFRWRRNGVDLTNGGRISGADTAMLQITSVQSSDSGSYDCVIRDTCLTLPAGNGSCGTSTNSNTSVAAQLFVSTVPPLEVGNTLLAQKGGVGQFAVRWTDIADAVTYTVYEDTTPGGSFATVTGTASSGTVGVTTSLAGANRFYLVAASNGCGEGPKN